MYMFKEDIPIRINKTTVSKIIGIDRSFLSLILNRKRHCSKVVAFCITKFLDKNAEIEDYFEKEN